MCLFHWVLLVCCSCGCARPCSMPRLARPRPALPCQAAPGHIPCLAMPGRATPGPAQPCPAMPDSLPRRAKPCPARPSRASPLLAAPDSMPCLARPSHAAPRPAQPKSTRPKGTTPNNASGVVILVDLLWCGQCGQLHSHWQRCQMLLELPVVSGQAVGVRCHC